MSFEKRGLLYRRDVGLSSLSLDRQEFPQLFPKEPKEAVENKRSHGRN